MLPFICNTFHNDLSSPSCANPLLLATHRKKDINPTFDQSDLSRLGPLYGTGERVNEFVDWWVVQMVTKRCHGHCAMDWVRADATLHTDTSLISSHLFFYTQCLIYLSKCSQIKLNFLRIRRINNNQYYGFKKWQYIINIPIWYLLSLIYYNPHSMRMKLKSVLILNSLFCWGYFFRDAGSHCDYEG